MHLLTVLLYKGQRLKLMWRENSTRHPLFLEYTVKYDAMVIYNIMNNVYFYAYVEKIHYQMKSVKYEEPKNNSCIRVKKKKNRNVAFACGAQAAVTSLLLQGGEIEVDAINGPGSSLKGGSVDMCY